MMRCGAPIDAQVTPLHYDFTAFEGRGDLGPILEAGPIWGLGRDDHWRNRKLRGLVRDLLG